MSFAEILLTNATVIAAVMVLTWLLSLRLRDASIVDMLWGAGFVVIAWITFALTDGGGKRPWLLAMTTLWGLRLSGYLTWRNLGKGEDYRYRSMRDHYGSRFPIVSLFVVFGLQGTIMWIVSLPIQVGLASAAESPSLTPLNYLGMVVWGIGFCFESLGDFQLARFKAHPENQGKVMDQGLWRYTRHPNYFGDFLVWWGIFLVATSSFSQTWTVVSPLLMSFLLLKVSGVALLEKSLKTKSPEYADYIRRTSAFFPWCPRASSP
jgi:steroid 5-alpha reductase family enzyme